MTKQSRKTPKILLTALLPLALAACVETGGSSSGPAMGASETNAVIGMLGLGCKNRISQQFSVPNSDITVRPGATLQQAINSGSMSAADLRRAGASFDWEILGRSARGYCNVDGSGRVTDFQQW